MGNNLVTPVSSPELVARRKLMEQKVAWAEKHLAEERAFVRSPQLKRDSFESEQALGRLRATTRATAEAQATLRHLKWLEREDRRRASE
jgi:hypothetical protein